MKDYSNHGVFRGLDQRLIRPGVMRFTMTWHANLVFTLIVDTTMTVGDGDYKCGTEQIVHLIHETFLLFLADGRYFDYRVERLGHDPDST